MENTPKIYAAICAIIGEVGAIGKNKYNTFHKFAYRGIDDVMSALQPLFAKHKVFAVPTVLENERSGGMTKAGGLSYQTVTKIKYTFYAEDGSFVESIVIGEGFDTGDKSSNKALAVAFKYALFQVFCIATEEMKDPDAESHEIVASLQELPKQAIELFQKKEALVNNWLIKNGRIKEGQTFKDVSGQTLNSIGSNPQGFIDHCEKEQKNAAQ